VARRTSKGRVISFAVQYDALINGKWVEITRVDTQHGSAHRHMFSPNGKETKTPFYCNSYNEGLTEAVRFVTENFQRLRDNYKLTARSKRRL
jgi:hypothetical protein